MSAKKQLELIKKSKLYFGQLEKKNINLLSSSFTFLSPWVETPGYGKLLIWSYGYKKIFQIIKIILKSILSILKINEYVVYNNLIQTTKTNKIVISYSRKYCFLENGSYSDEYFKMNSRDDIDLSWILISQDNYVPRKLDENIHIIYTENRAFFKRLYFFIKLLIKLLIAKKLNLIKVIHEFTVSTVQANIIANKVRKILSNNLDKIIIPYEAQPLHLSLYKVAKDKNIKCLTIGYIHSSLPSFPIDTIYRTGSPDILFVHGQQIKDILVNYFFWPVDKIRLIRSIRFHKNIKNNFSNKILLPYSFNYSQLLLQTFKNYINTISKESFSNYIVQIHPEKKISKKHLKFKKQIKQILDNRNYSLSSNKVIIFGSTSTVVLALELGYSVIHIVCDPLMEVFYDEIWENIVSKKINKYIYEYKLRKKNSFIDFGSSEKTLTYYLDNINK
tara:strand:+ start:52725 stop:54062 length:1338 start_codon:yes stop_codon:yes gene_type:complete